MNPITLFLAVGLALASWMPTASMAQTNGMSPELSACLGQAGNAIQTGDCLGQALSREESRMANAFARVQATAAAIDTGPVAVGSAQALFDAQTAWFSYRTAHCGFAGTTFGGGSGTSNAVSFCMVDLTRARTAELLTFAQQ